MESWIVTKFCFNLDRVKIEWYNLYADKIGGELFYEGKTISSW